MKYLMRGNTMNNNDSTLCSAPETIDVGPLVAEIAALDPGYYLTLGDDSPAYEEPTDVRVRPASDFYNAETVAAKIGKRSETIVTADVYDLTGRKVPRSERPSEWWEQQKAITPPTSAFYVANAVHRLGHDYLIVGRGEFYVAGETVLDGERAFETITVEEAMRRDLEALEEYMPAVLAAKPEWAEEPTVKSIDDNSDDDTIGVFYALGGFLPDGFNSDVEVRIDQYVVIARQTGAVVRVDPLTATTYLPEPRYSGDTGLTVDELRTLSGAFASMADALDRIKANA